MSFKIKLLFLTIYILDALWVKTHIDNGSYGNACFMAMMALAILPFLHQRWWE